MKKTFYLFLILLTLFTGCEKRKVDSNQPDRTEIFSAIPDKTEILSVLENENTVQDVNTTQIVDDIHPEVLNIIDSYYYVLEFGRLPSDIYRTPGFLIEGNFTGSGNRELIRFYEQSPIGSFKSIQDAYCFVLTPNGDSIENTYFINYMTGNFTSRDVTDSGLFTVEDLGRPIIWDDFIIGYAGDFNDDGKEELYLYLLSGMASRPIIFGFEDTEFVELIDLPIGGVNISITGVDKNEKTISLQQRFNSDDYEDPRSFVSDRTYKWDTESRRYEEISTYTEVVRHRWNPETEQIDVIRTRWNRETRQEEEL